MQVGVVGIIEGRKVGNAVGAMVGDSEKENTDTNIIFLIKLIMIKVSEKHIMSLLVGEAVGSIKQDTDPGTEYCPVEQFVHLSGPINIVRVALKSALTSDSESTLLYIRKSLIDQLK